MFNIRLPLPSVPNPEIAFWVNPTPFIKNVKLVTDVGGNCEPADGSRNEVPLNVAVLVVTIFATLVILVAM